MPRLIFLTLTVLTVITLPAHARRNSSAQRAPRVVTPSTSFSFGDVYRGEIISQVFVVKNDGDAEVKLTDFTGTCGCEVTRWDKSVPPGKEGWATLEVQTVSQSGEISKTAILHTNDPERPTIVFTLNANVLGGVPLRQGRYIGPIFISPEARVALYASPGKKASTEISITADNAAVKVVRVEGGTKRFNSRIETIEPGRTYKVIVESLPIETPDLYFDQLRIFTDSESLPVFTVDVSLRVYARQQILRRSDKLPVFRRIFSSIQCSSASPRQAGSLPDPLLASLMLDVHALDKLAACRTTRRLRIRFSAD